jgi:hypothetical protein
MVTSKYLVYLTSTNLFMKNLKLTFIFLLLVSFVKAQDSIKAINHELGFNAVSLVKQLISNSPNNTIAQLPYTFFYNLYFKDMVGIRTGFGISALKNETDIEGQDEPRTSTSSAFNVRVGVSYNFVKQNRITFNAFFDNIIESVNAKTANTFTSQTFPNPIEKTTTTSTDKTTGFGGQIGVGVKYNIYKRLSIYTEIPLSFITRSIASEVLIEETGSPDDKTTTKITDQSLKVTVPATIYLVLRF